MKRFSKVIGLTSLGLAASLSVAGIASIATVSCSQTAPIVTDPQQFITDYGTALFNPMLVDEFTNQLTEDVIWRIEGDSDRLWYSGDYQGREAVQEFFANMTRTFIWTEFTPLDILTEERETPLGGRETRVAVRVAQTGKGTFTGRVFQGDFVYLFTLGEDGRIASFEGFYNTYPAAAAATGVNAPDIPDNDPLTGQPVTIDQTIDAEMARQVAIDNWQALIDNNLERVSELNASSTQWSFAIGAPDFLPYGKTAQGITSDGQPLNPDFSNAGAIITQILQPRMNVVAPGNLAIQDTFANGNRVLVHLRETNATALETGNQYDIDIFSWITVNAEGRITSNEVIVDTYQTVEALRPDAMFPLPASPQQVRRYPPFYVTGSRVNGIVAAFDQQGNYTGILGQANPTDSQLVQPSAITYGPNGDLYVTSSDAVDRTRGNEILVYDGVSGEFKGVFGQATNAESGLLNPTGIKFGPDGNLYVASAFTSQVLRYNGETGEFMGVYATRNNGFPNNTVPEDLPVPDFTVLVFGPDGNLYVTSLLENAVLEYAGPNAETPGEFIGVYGQANGNDSELAEPRSIAFGPDADLYVTSAATGRILKYAGPTKQNPGAFLGVYADIANEVSTEMNVQDMDFNQDGTADRVIQNGLGFGTDGNLYVSSSIELAADPMPMPTGGSQVRIYSGPLHRDAGAFLGVFGQADTDSSRLLLPTTPEFVYDENTFPSTHRYDRIAFVVGANTDRAPDAAGTPGFFQSDNTDALAAYDQNMRFLGFLNQDLLGSSNPVNGIGGVTLAPNGHLLVSSQLSNQVLQFNSLTGQYMGVFGEASSEGTGDNPNTTENEGLNFPAGITVGPDNNVYLTDLRNKRVLRFDGYTGEFLDDPDTSQNEGVVVQLTDEEDVRFTDLAFGPDGRLYIGFNPPLEQPTLGTAEVRVYRPDGVLETRLIGTLEQPLDFVAALDVGPDGRLYVGDDPASLVDPATGQPLAPDRQSRLLIYEIPNVHPLIVNPETGQGDPNGVRQQPTLINQFEIGIGNAGGLTVDTDGTIYISEPVAGQIARYNANGELLGTLSDFRLPDAARQENGGVDADGRPRPTGSIFIKPMQ
ncbi:MAG: nuclear transport factor 2 family protein [Synechococcales cyanobacterium C42_A2020_086]|nr:nuclear transport factor 2 family protein [Synechococcales cyanobacterium C42_A2020_086]